MLHLHPGPHWKTKRKASCADARAAGRRGFGARVVSGGAAKILMDEAEANNLGDKAKNGEVVRWHDCSLCEPYHGVVEHALGWACCHRTWAGRRSIRFGAWLK